MNLIYSYLSDFISLFFPELCLACGNNLFKNESVICTHCIHNLPYTNFHLDRENRVAKQLYGRIPFVSAAALLYFNRGSKVQKLIHQLKYHNRPEIGVRMGEIYGHQLKKLDEFTAADLIIPVPLHPARLKKRGYNQSRFFAQGLSGILGIPYHTEILSRPVATVTQTHKSRFSRYENMKGVFAVKNPEALENKHILLVDDVLTTGATLEASAEELLKTAGVKISIVTIAFAN